MPLLPFTLDDLEECLQGQKTCTARYDTRLKSLKVGQNITMQFGARNKPRTFDARCTRIEFVNLEPDLKLMDGNPSMIDELEQWEENVFQDETGELVELVFAQWDHMPVFVEGCDATQTMPLTHVLECHAKLKTGVYFIWFNQLIERKA